MKKLSIILGILLTVVACKTVYVPVPSTTSTTVNVKDSVALHIKDSVRLIERSVYKDYTGLLDTLSISLEKASMRAWADTSRNLIAGELKTEPVEEKTKIVYRDRLVYKDSVRIEEKPVPYEVEKLVKYTPWYSKVLSSIGIISILTISSNRARFDVDSMSIRARFDVDSTSNLLLFLLLLSLCSCYR